MSTKEALYRTFLPIKRIPVVVGKKMKRKEKEKDQ
jgi:hypothetical protein